MERLKLLYLALIAIIGLLAFSITYKTASQTISPTVTRLAKQDLITAGDEVIANFRIYNPDSKSHVYTYGLYLNDEKRFENTVIVHPEKNFVFGGQYRYFKPGKVKVSATVYIGEEKKLLDNITYYVTVKPRDD